MNYVWLVGQWHSDDDWAVVGICSSEERAREIAPKGAFISIIPVDDELMLAELSVEWVE